MLKGLIFDMDGTVVNNSALHIEAFRIFFERHGCREPFSQEWFARRNEDIMMHYIPEECAKYGWETLSDEKEEVYRDTFKDVIKPVEGLVELVKAAHAAGLKCCIGSSAPRQNVEFHLDVCGIREYMCDWLCMEDVKIGKPDPDVYLKCCSRMGLDPSECIVFEDATAGIEAGKRAGCKVVGLATWNSVETLQQKTAADLVVRNFTECPISELEKLVL